MNPGKNYTRREFLKETGKFVGGGISNKSR